MNTLPNPDLKQNKNYEAVAAARPAIRGECRRRIRATSITDTPTGTTQGR